MRGWRGGPRTHLCEGGGGVDDALTCVRGVEGGGPRTHLCEGGGGVDPARVLLRGDSVPRLLESTVDFIVFVERPQVRRCNDISERKRN